MSDLSVPGQITNAAGSGTAVATLNGVTAGNCIVAFLWSGGGAPSLPTVIDSQGTYVATGPAAIDSGNGVWVRAYVLESANSGTHVVTGTGVPANGTDLYLIEIGSSGTSVSSGNSQFQSGAGSGTDAITSGSITFAAAATVVGMSTDSSVVSAGAEPNVGTGFTSRDNGTNGDIGSWRIETGAFSSSHAATFNAGSGPADPTVTVGVAILNSGGGGGISLLTGQSCL